MNKFLLIDHLGIYHTTGSYFPQQYPNLGAAILLSTLKKEKVPYDFIEQGTECIKDILFDYPFDTVKTFKSSLKNPADFKILNELYQFGEKAVVKQLKKIYSLITERAIQVYSNENLLYYINRLFQDIVMLYKADIESGNVPAFINRILSRIKTISPDMIGVSLYDYEPFSRCLIREIKKQFAIPVIAGGSISYFISYEEIIKNLFDDLQIDYFLWGRAEHSLPQLIKSHCDNRDDFSDIPNLIYKQNKDIKKNNMEQKISLNQVVIPDYEDFHFDKYFSPMPIIPLQASEGCYWKKCRFCDVKIKRGHYSRISTSYLMEQMCYYQNKYNAKAFIIADESTHPDFAAKIAQSILKKDLKVYLCSPMRSEVFLTADHLTLYHQAGWRIIFWGIESGNQRMLDQMNKGTTVLHNSHILKQSSQAGISNYCSFLLGFPGEDDQSINDTIDFIKNHSPYIDYFRTNFYILNKSDDVQKFGLDKQEYTQLRKKAVTQIEELMKNEYQGVWKLRSNRFSIPKQLMQEEQALFLFVQSILEMTDGESVIRDKQKSENTYPYFVGFFKKAAQRQYISPLPLLFHFDYEIDSMTYQILKSCTGNKNVNQIADQLSISNITVFNIVYEFSKKKLIVFYGSTLKSILNDNDSNKKCLI